MANAGEPFSIPRFQSRLTTAWLGRDFRFLPVVNSTMDAVRDLALRGAENGLVLAADEQSAGRGRLGRRWLAPPGLNLSFSILLRPSLSQLKVLSMVAPLAVVEGVRDVCSLQATVKWPNDVQVGGRKLAGILLESELTGDEPVLAIVGIGLNVNFETSVEPEIAGLATSMLVETGRWYEREAVLAACLLAFEQQYEEPAAHTHAAWRARLNTLGRHIVVRMGDVLEEGLAEDVADDGSLTLLRPDGTRINLAAGEVTLRL